MKRVVITGMGIWSCIGQDLQTVTESLRQGFSGIIFDPQRIDYGMLSGLVGDVPRPDLKSILPRKARAVMSSDAEFAYMAARQAFDQAGITDDYLCSNEVSLIWGNDGNSHQIDYSRIMEEEHSSTLIGYPAMIRSLTSSVAINLSSLFHLKGTKFTISSGCSSASHAIGVATFLIRAGMHDMILIGGSQEVDMRNITGLVGDSLTRFPDSYAQDPSIASRPFDENQQGSIPSGGAAALVIEEYEHALKRGAPILAEIIGYGASSGIKEEIYLPDSKAEVDAITKALEDANIKTNDIDCIISHAMALDDSEEAKALSQLFEGHNTPIGATESITGHEGAMMGASGVVYGVLMMQNGFMSPNVNLEHPIPEAKGLNIVSKTEFKTIRTILCNSTSIGDSYCSLVLQKNI